MLTSNYPPYPAAPMLAVSALAQGQSAQPAHVAHGLGGHGARIIVASSEATAFPAKLARIAASDATPLNLPPIQTAANSVAIAPNDRIQFGPSQS